MSKFDYPRLSRSEIIMILAESQVAAVVDNDLKNPIPDFVADLYARILVHLGLLPEEDPGQLEFADLEQLENPDHHVDSVRTMNLYIKIRESIALLDCPLKFTLKDLLRPQGDRTEYFLSAFLNFLLHKNTKFNLLHPTVEELDLLENQQRDWEEKISQIKAEIADYNVARERELPLVQEVDARVKELHQMIAGLNSQQMSLRASYRKLKEKDGEMDGKISKAEFDLVQSVQDNANLRSKIVQSPDKLQRALEEKKSVREQAKNAERSAMQSFQDKTALLEVYTKSLKKMSKHSAQMQTIQEHVNSAKSIEKEYKALKAKLGDDEVLDKSLDAKLIERQGKVKKLEELKKLLEKERDLKCDDAAKEFNNIKSKVELQRLDLEERQRKVEAVVAEVDAITSKTNLVKESGAAKVQVLLGKCEEIVEQFQQYTKSAGLLLSTVEVEAKTE